MHNADMFEGPQIKEMRTQLGESQVVFGARFGVDQSTVHRWETETPPKRGPALLALRSLHSELFKKAEEAAE
jgi:DNA-binding transcriptional regulator YiaG